jgi:hypothetical protein
VLAVGSHDGEIENDDDGSADHKDRHDIPGVSNKLLPEN